MYKKSEVNFETLSCKYHIPNIESIFSLFLLTYPTVPGHFYLLVISKKCNSDLYLICSFPIIWNIYIDTDRCIKQLEAMGPHWSPDKEWP